MHETSRERARRAGCGRPRGPGASGCARRRQHGLPRRPRRRSEPARTRVPPRARPTTTSCAAPRATTACSAAAATISCSAAPGATASSAAPAATSRSNSVIRTMPLYLSRFSYTPETWSRLIGNPEDRRKAAQSYIESVGGKLHGFWYAFGTHDGYNLWEAPDNVSMAAVALAISGGGALSSFETTVLLTVDETMDALRMAEQVQYRAPSE